MALPSRAPELRWLGVLRVVGLRALGLGFEVWAWGFGLRA